MYYNAIDNPNNYNVYRFAIKSRYNSRSLKSKTEFEIEFKRLPKSFHKN